MNKLIKGLRKSIAWLIRKMPWSYQDRIFYFHTFRKLPNLRKPRLFNEKILYRKIIMGDYVRYGHLSDKLLVREYIAQQIGNNYLIPLLYETKDPTTLLSLKSLKNNVIKPNHGSGMVEVLLEEPDCIRKQQLVARCNEWLRMDFSAHSREIHYRFIKPRILVEQYIGDGNLGAIDYKFHMFNKRDGHFEYVLQVIYNRSGQGPLSMIFYVNNLKHSFHKIRDTGLDISAQMPSLEKALQLSKVLASDFDYVRVDWYIHEGRIYFGELTFTPGAGLVTGLDRGLDRIMGDMWQQDRKSISTAPKQGIAMPGVLKKI
ncbi:hypothetical protein BL250_13255 [Erwinia sp. OLTSP20]|uniref:ATP-grasp fold amidoligase family protein n=1 Tax=unclassified Erwinia TaxID=2622719 RepID=UPI000C181415|nr:MULTISPECIES: ATP-grasp fold amidoligase family protein [unclassified Erwinia]PIJ50387.1 hypothetical protein BV501_08820 [Erwinia sp. OAMSP11]PIJ71646.1 hypothetical protein BK416_11200 [Erwinia sp. OLSSP12]PIJ81030.1 hypothetical protein BLD47_10060 [Erwinia sp. OLCASP19]PIJ83288.1 hypothetical protein BLD46_10060 [Erwinia sp. OLMTSP26]PIJ85968.1 hypothetical protein BLD49_09365 [Erwinia sp. OLMDSP33]